MRFFRSLKYLLVMILAVSCLVLGVLHLDINHIPEDPLSSLYDSTFEYIDVSQSSGVPQMILKSTVSINIRDPFHAVMSSIGTGIVMKSQKFGSTILTAEHVAMASWSNDLYACSIIDETKCVSLGTAVVDLDESLVTDWAIFRVDSPPEGTKAARISQRDASIGDNVFLIGMPWGRSPWLSKGMISWFMGESDERVMFVTGFAAPGFSGGGVFNEKGRLVGLTVALAVSEWGPQENQILVVPIQNVWLY